MTWVTWRQYRYQAALAAALLAALAVVLLISGLHAAQVWHAALAGCRTDHGCGNPSLSGPCLHDARRRDVRGAAAARAVLGRPDGGA